MSINHENVRPDTRTRAFTLVELLVVISIVSVLLTLLLPSLSRARTKAQQIVCLSNERQFSMAFNLYLMDKKNLYPYGNEAQTPITLNSFVVFGSNGSVWVESLSGYIPNSVPRNITGYNTINTAVSRKIRCPANPWLNTGAGGGSWAGLTYAMNTYSNQSTPFPYSYGNGVVSSGDPFLNPSKLIRQVRHDSLRKPSSICLIADAPNMPYSAATNGQFPWASNSSYASMFLDSTAFTSGSTSNNTWKVSIATYGPGADEMGAYTRVNHDTGWNVLHADGHASYYSKTTMETIARNTAAGTAYTAFWKNN